MADLKVLLSQAQTSPLSFMTKEGYQELVASGHDKEVMLAIAHQNPDAFFANQSHIAGFFDKNTETLATKEYAFDERSLT